MKFPITDKFLLDIYSTVSDIEDSARMFIHPPRTMRDIILMIDDPVYQKYHKLLKGENFKKLIYWLKKNNYIKAKNLKNGKAVILTKKGITKALKASLRVDSAKKQKRKDGKLIMIMFDLPKAENRKRGLLRNILQNLGYTMFQKSVWMSQYDVYEKSETSLQFHSLDKYVKIFLIEEL